jgi:ABC-type glycerol-3-phosphate transport system substrate-binding protein
LYSLISSSEDREQQSIKLQIGLLPFPLPDESYEPSTLMGGWLLSISTTSKNKDLAWELITLAAEPKILAPWLAKYGYKYYVISLSFKAILKPMPLQYCLHFFSLF